MVLSSLIINLMKSALSPYIENFNADQLNVFGWSGHMQLSELHIKANAFDNLKLPFRITQGYVGQIEVTVPWMNIYTEPIVIRISDIYAVVVPNTEIEYNESEERDYEWQLKKSYLENIESIKQKLEEDSKEKSQQDDGFFMKLITAAIKNIQISISKVHVVYEDATTGERLFQIGLAFSRLIFETEQNAKQETVERLIKKIIRWEGFCFYLNHSNVKRLFGQEKQTILTKLRGFFDDPKDTNYILCPIEFATIAVIDRKPEASNYKYPICDLDMHLNEFQIKLDDKQVRAMLHLLDSIDRLTVASLYRKWRPKVPVKENPKLWWKFLYSAIAETGTRRRKKEFSWDNIIESCKKRKAYIELYKRKLLGQHVDPQELENLEKSLSLVVIVMARAEAEMATKKAVKEQKEKTGWFGSWWSSSKNDQSGDNVIENLKKEFTEGKEKEKLYQAIGYDENSLPMVMYPVEYVAHKLSFHMNKFYIVLLSEKRKICVNALENLTFNFKNRPSSGNLQVDVEFDSIHVDGMNNIHLMKSESPHKFLLFKMVINPLDKNSDYSLQLEVKGLRFLYDINTVNELARLFSPPDNISLDEIKAAAQYKLDDIRLVTYSQVQNAIDKHKQIDLRIKLHPSFVIVPKQANFETSDTLLLISLGELKVGSKLVPKTNANKVVSLNIVEDMKKHVYETYTIHIKNVQVMLSNKKNYENDMEQLNTERHILFPFELILNFHRSIITNDPRFPEMDIDGNIPSIDLKASDIQISILLFLLTTLPYGPTIYEASDIVDKPEPQLVTQPKVKPAVVTDEVKDALKYAAIAAKEINKMKQEDQDKKAASLETESKMSVVICKNLIFSFKLKEISITVYQNNRNEESKFTRIQLIKLSIYGEILSDQTLWINCNVCDLLAVDLRHRRNKNGILTMLSKSNRKEDLSNEANNEEDKNILTVYMAQKVEEMIVILTMSNFVLILAVDYLLALAEIGTKVAEMKAESVDKMTIKTSTKSRISTSVKPSASAALKAQADKLKEEKKAAGSKIAIEFSLKKMEIFMLESLDNIFCEALVFNCFSKLNLKIEEDVIILCGSVRKMNVSLINYGDYVSTGRLEAYIMAPTDLNLNGTIKGNTQMMDLSFDDIYINISPSMLPIILRIMSAISGPPVEDPKDKNVKIDLSKLLEPKPINKRLWYLHYAPPANEALSLLKQPESSEQKSTILLNLNKIIVFIKSGGVESQPLVKVDLSTLAKLEDNKNLSFECSILSNYYNHLLSVWEPLIEPVDNKVFAFRGKVILDEPLKVEIQTIENLEILLTRTSVNILYKITEAFSQVMETRTKCSDQFNSVILKNYLGVKIKLLLKDSNILEDVVDLNSSSSKQAITGRRQNAGMVLESGKKYKFRSKDHNNIKLLVHIIFSDEVVIERTIMCRKTCTRCYFTAIKTYPVNENWKFVVQVADVGATKEIIFRSNTEIRNNFDNKFELYRSLNDDMSHIGTIKPHSTFYLPIPLVYGESLLYVKPNDDYELCVPPFLWRETLEKPARENSKSCFVCSDRNVSKRPPYLILSCINKADEKKQFQVKLRGAKNLISYEDTNRKNNKESYLYTVKMIPLARLCNLLPYPIEFEYTPLNELKTLEPGEDFNLPFIEFGESIIKYRLLEYLGQKWTASEQIPESGNGDDVTVAYYKFTSSNGIDRLTLPVEFRIDNSTLVLSLFSQCWIMNRTNELVRISVDDQRQQVFKTNKKFPHLFSYETRSKKPRMYVALNDSEPSRPFPIDVAPFKLTVMPKARGQKYSYALSVNVEASKILQTKIINIESFYSIINLTPKKIFFSENNEDWFQVESNELTPFYPRKMSNQSMCFRLANNGFDSKHISLCQSSQTLLSVDNGFIFVEVLVDELEAKVRISDYFDGAAPALLVNKLKVPIYYGQQDVSDWKTHKHIRELPVDYFAYFCWIDPMKTRKMIFKLSLDQDEYTAEIEFDTFVKISDKCSWVSFLDGKQRVVLFTEDMTLPENLLMTHEFIKPDIHVELIIKGFGLNIVDNEKRLDLFYLSIKSNTIWECRSETSKTFKAVSIKENDILEKMYQNYLLVRNNSSASIIKADRSNYQANFENMTLLKPRLAYLRRVANRGLWVTYTASPHTQNIHVRINDIQLDNQLSDHIFDVVFAPVVVPKSVSDKFEIERKHFIELCAIICPGTIPRYKHIQLLIQEFMVQIELGWVFKIMNVFDIKTVDVDTNKHRIQSDIDYIRKYHSPEELQKYMINKAYYDFLMLGPIKIHLSVNFGEGVTKGNNFFLLELIVRLGGTVGEISDALFKLDYFERKLLFLGTQELVDQLTEHYKNQILLQFYKLILGLDIIGNPMKLAMGITKGVGDFFYEPAVGIIHGPEEFAEGLAIGVKSLASGVIGGTAGALGRIGSSLGTGVAALTVDDKFQKERRERMNKKANFAQNSKNLFKGIVSGITGVVTKPIEGAKEDGGEGFIKGVGKGVVGLFAQPATSVIDFASGSLHAFNNAIDPKKVAQPVRIPRAFSRQEIKPYSHHQAKGCEILANLSNSKFSRDEYVDHIQMSNNQMIMLTNRHLISLKMTFLSSQWDVDWYEPWKNCQEVYVDRNSIHIKLKVAKKNLIPAFESPKERIIAFSVSNDQDRGHVKNVLQNLVQRIDQMIKNVGNRPRARNRNRPDRPDGGPQRAVQASSSSSSSNSSSSSSETSPILVAP